jgi:triosephosphate isomerase
VSRGTPLPLVVGNWKMNFDETAAEALVSDLVRRLSFERAEVAVAPPFPCLRAAIDAAAGSLLAIAAQNVHAEDRGAYTGEVSASMLAAMGIAYVIVGHSERRRLFHETDAQIARKVAACRRCDLMPVVCVGETEEERRRGLTREIVVAQIRAAFSDLAIGGTADLVVAYEPVWAIGTGVTPRIDEVASAHEAIRGALTTRFGSAASALRILYGGSVTPDNAGALLAAEGVDGALVGGASLDAASFASIVGAC